MVFEKYFVIFKQHNVTESWYNISASNWLFKIIWSRIIKIFKNFDTKIVLFYQVFYLSIYFLIIFIIFTADFECCQWICSKFRIMQQQYRRKNWKFFSSKQTKTIFFHKDTNWPKYCWRLNTNIHKGVYISFNSNKSVIFQKKKLQIRLVIDFNQNFLLWLDDAVRLRHVVRQMNWRRYSGITFEE